MVQRATAYKMKINDILSSEYHSGGDIENPNFVDFNGLKVTRASVTGKITDKFESPEKNFSSIIIEDEGEKIKVKFFDFKPDVQTNELVKVIGKIRENEEGRFILGEIVKKVTEAEKTLHELETQKQHSKPSFVEDTGSA